MKKFKAVLGLIMFVVMAIAFYPTFMEFVRLDNPNTTEKLAQKEAWAEYDWTLEIPNMYSTIIPLNYMENRFAVMTGSRKCGVIDCYGNEIVPLKDHSVDIRNDAVDGVYAIAVDSFNTGKYSGYQEIIVWGFVDESGDYIVVPRFKQVQMFTGNYAAVYDDTVWRVVDKEDNIVYTFNEGEVPLRTSEEGVFWVDGNGLHGMLNILTSEYTYLEEMPVLNTDAPVQSALEYDTEPLKATYTYTDENGNLVSDRVFDSFVTTADGYAIVRKNTALGGAYTGIIRLEVLE